MGFYHLRIVKGSVIIYKKEQRKCPLFFKEKNSKIKLAGFFYGLF